MSSHDGWLARSWVTLVSLALVTACAGGTPSGSPSTGVRSSNPIGTTTRGGPSSTSVTTLPATQQPTAVPIQPPLTVGGNAWVAVSVATLWRTPTSVRAVDLPALANPARVREWLSGMMLADRRGLNGRADTQTLMGDRVVVVARSGSWVKVVVPDQPTPLSSVKGDTGLRLLMTDIWPSVARTK